MIKRAAEDRGISATEGTVGYPVVVYVTEPGDMHDLFPMRAAQGCRGFMEAESV